MAKKTNKTWLNIAADMGISTFQVNEATVVSVQDVLHQMKEFDNVVNHLNNYKGIKPETLYITYHLDQNANIHHHQEYDKISDARYAIGNPQYFSTSGYDTKSITRVGKRDGCAYFVDIRKYFGGEDA